VYLDFAGSHAGGELSNVAAGFGKALVGNICSLSYGRDEAISDGVRGVMEVTIVIHVKDHFG